MLLNFSHSGFGREWHRVSCAFFI